MRIAGFALACVLALGTATADAQDQRELRGTVEDRTGGVIVGAVVRAESVAGAASETATDGAGRYRLPSLAPGVHVVTISSPGFADFVTRTDLTSRRARTLDATLQIAMREEVEVTASVSAGNDTISTFTVSGKDIDTMPDDPAAFLRRLQELMGTAGGDAAPVRVDGFAPGGRIPPKAAIQMIRFVTNAFAAEFTEPGRGMIEIVTKPGTANFLGEMSANFNDDALNARNALATRRTPMQTRALSGYVAGPIVPNRWGFQVYGGHWMRDTENLINATVLGRDALLAQPFVSTLASGTRTRSVNVNTDFLIGKQHRLAVSVDYLEERGANLGLGSGLDLPERAFTRSGVTPAGNLALTSASNAGATHELRLEWSRPRNETRARSTQPAVLVLDAFNGGGNQRSLFRNDTGISAKLADRASLTRGRYRFKVGLDVETVRSAQTDESEFGGTFVFGSDFERDPAGIVVRGTDGAATAITPLENYRRALLGLPGYGPSQLTIERGDPRLVYDRWWLGAFAQVDWTASPRFSLSYGVRHTVQADVKSARDLAPRAAATWTLDEKSRSRIRAGAGLFHQQIPPVLFFNSLRYDGRRQRFIVPQPVFSTTSAVATITADYQQSSSTYRISDQVFAPRVLMSAMSFERNLPRGMSASIGLNTQIGSRLLRMRNINIPMPGQAGVPQPGTGPVFAYESTGRSRRYEIPVSWRGHVSKRVNLRGNYTLGFRRSDTEGPSSAPADPYDFSAEFGPSDSDRRHRGFGTMTLSLPGAVEVGASASFSSGRPFNITTGRDNNGDSLFTDRPAIVPAGSPAAVVTVFGVFDPNPVPGQGIIPRNYGREPGETRLDMYASKAFKPGGRNDQGFTLSITTTNLLNTVNLSGATGVITSHHLRTVPARRRCPACRPRDEMEFLNGAGA